MSNYPPAAASDGRRPAADAYPANFNLNNPTLLKAKEELFDFSRFDGNAILRGAQLTLVGAQRALQNPNLWTSQHYKQAAIAVGCGIAIRLLVEIPVILVKVFLFFLSFFISRDSITWDETLGDGLRFLQEYVLQVPLFMMTLMRHITPAMDELFMVSLQWVDYTYAQKHKHEGPIDPRQRYYDNLRAYAQVSHRSGQANSERKGGIYSFLQRFAKKTFISLAIYALSYVPVFGRLVLPAASFYTFRGAVGLGPAAVIFGTGIFLPRRYLIMFLQTYFGSRSLMRELLGPYFSRVRFSSKQRRHWFRNREGILFGFGAGFYVLLRVPLVGVLIYGIAEASTAYLVTKITDPPPASATTADLQVAFAESQEKWHNKKAFLEAALDNLDAMQRQARVITYAPDPERPGNVDAVYRLQKPAVESSPGAWPEAFSSSAGPAAGSSSSSTGVDPGRPSASQQQLQQQYLQQQQLKQQEAPPSHNDPPPPYSAVAGQ